MDLLSTIILCAAAVSIAILLYFNNRPGNGAPTEVGNLHITDNDEVYAEFDRTISELRGAKYVTLKIVKDRPRK